MAACQAQGCKMEVPAALGESALCVHHYLVWLDGNCAAMRRETAPSGATTARHDEIADFIRVHGEHLSHVATGGIRLSDAMKASVLNAFLASSTCAKTWNAPWSALREPIRRACSSSGVRLRRTAISSRSLRPCLSSSSIFARTHATNRGQPPAIPVH